MMAKEVAKKVKPNDKKKIVMVHSPFHKSGEEIEVHPEQAEKLINKGFAKLPGEKDPPKPGAKVEEKKDK